MLIDVAAVERPLAGDHVVLEPLSTAHADELFPVLSDLAIYSFLDETPPSSIEWLAARYSKLQTRISPDAREVWLNWVVRSREGEPLGYVQATVYEDSRAEIAYVLGSKFWGLGLAYEASRVMLGELKQQYDVSVVFATTASANARSRRLLARLGFGAVDAKEYPFGQLDPADIAYVLNVN